MILRLIRQGVYLLQDAKAFLMNVTSPLNTEDDTKHDRVLSELVAQKLLLQLILSLVRQ